MADTLAALRALPDLGDAAPPETEAIAALLVHDRPSAAVSAAARARALRYVEAVRNARPGLLSAQNLLNSFPLASAEGVALLRLAEALLRAPDPETQTWLIAEKLAAFKERGSGNGEAFVTRVLGRALQLAGHTAADAELRGAGGDAGTLRAWLARSTLRPLVIDGIRRFGDQFVFATGLPAALARSRKQNDQRIVFSFDMLGEGARTQADADRAYASYQAAVAAMGRGEGDWRTRDGVSIKLSAIHPRYELSQIDRVENELYPRLLELARQAATAGLNLTIDAEESERLVLHVALFERLMLEPELAGWAGLGLALQAYSPRALATLERLLALSLEHQRPIAIRLVKGAYWDAEIKHAQEAGLAGFPVFTRKWGSDLAYLALARRLLASPAPVYSQFATHNAMTVAAIVDYSLELAPTKPFEFQRLHGMGEALYEALLADQPQSRVRIYAPVGEFRDLLAYLVRRLLENGANSSFVHQLTDDSVPATELVGDAYAEAEAALAGAQRLPALPTGAELFGKRRNSIGLDFGDPAQLLALASAVARPLPPADVGPMLAGPTRPGAATELPNPAALAETVTRVSSASPADIESAIAAALAAQPDWDKLGAEARAQLLERAADAIELDQTELIGLLVREAGRTQLDSHLEVREAVDFCRYYASQARLQMADIELPGPVGESNVLHSSGRGVFVAISPWNFPLAIFLGQVAAALVTGNTVLAKPAEQTPRVAARTVELMHAAGVPRAVLQLLPGGGDTVGRALTSDPRIAGVVFTGSTMTARSINRALAARDAPIGVLIAETGGQNAMIVDSSALPEQVCDAVISGAFRSCGQRCSALRVLYLQDEIAESLIAMIAGAMAELVVGDPRDLATDVGPVIDAEQLAQLLEHRDWLRAHGKKIFECPTPAGDGHFFGPVAYEIDSIAQLERENFGPILHVVRFDKRRLDQVLADIHATGYGLTLGLHTRLDGRVEHLARHARVGNLYVNRNQIGAVVGSQPFGGEGLSGTGPKAGGPHYLRRFMGERTLTINTAAAGGNVELAAGLSNDA